MRTAVLILGLCLVALAVPMTAEAHDATCMFGDVPCTVQCMVDHVREPLPLPHRCRFWLP